MAKSKKMYSLEDIIPLLSEDSLKVASGMIEDAVFMQNQLRELREQIKRDGVSENYQYGSKPTAAMTTYLQVQKQYGVIIRYLTDLLPKNNKTAASADLLDWVNNN
jgi:expansin (peptidoglycan-binding protein)